MTHKNWFISAVKSRFRIPWWSLEELIVEAGCSPLMVHVCVCVWTVNLQQQTCRLDAKKTDLENKKERNT